MLMAPVKLTSTSSSEQRHSTPTRLEMGRPVRQLIDVSLFRDLSLCRVLHLDNDMKAGQTLPSRLPDPLVGIMFKAAILIESDPILSKDAIWFVGAKVRDDSYS
jgi:hypothetical protein